MSTELEAIKSTTFEENTLEISTGELFTYEWHISDLGELPNATAAFYKTIPITNESCIQVKVKRLPARLRHLPDYLHEGKIRIRDISLEIFLSCHSATYQMTECSMSLRTFVEDFSKHDVVVNNTFGECTEALDGNEYFAEYAHTDIMTYLGSKPHDVLTLVCQIEIIFTSPDISIHSDPSFHLERLFGNKQYTDFVFSVNGQDFPVHKAIVALWSPKFEAIFENNGIKREENRVAIDDVDSKVFREALRFIYTGKIENFYEIALGLLRFADKYDIKELKTVCEQRMCIHLLDLPVEDTVVLLAWSEMYNCEWLKARIIEFIVAQAKSITVTNAWKDLISKNPQLVNQVRDAMIRSGVPVHF